MFGTYRRNISFSNHYPFFFLICLWTFPISSESKLLSKIPSLTAFFVGPNPVEFLLYSKNGSGEIVTQSLLNGNVESVLNSKFDKDQTTTILVHGFRCDKDCAFPKVVAEAYVAASIPTNVIVADWGKLSKPHVPAKLEASMSPLVYPKVVTKHIPIAAEKVAEFVTFLASDNRTNPSGELNDFLKNLHVVGHSLGAHTSGLICHLLQEKSKGVKVKRLTGLDPAGPLFDRGLHRHQRHIQKDDGEFVDVYHTAMGSKGDNSVDGHVDFYPNGGAHQPGCTEDAHLTGAPSVINDMTGQGSCSHEFIAHIYAESIKNDFRACKCSYTLKSDELAKCMSECPEPVTAGERCPDTAKGEYYFETENLIPPTNSTR